MGYNWRYMELHGFTGSSGLCNSHIFCYHVKGAIMYGVFRNLHDMFCRVHNMYPHTITLCHVLSIYVVLM
jgi:hypothetical protein